MLLIAFAIASLLQSGCHGNSRSDGTDQVATAKAYEEVLQVVRRTDRIEIEFANDVMRISPIVVTDRNVISAIGKELEKLQDLAEIEESRRFKTVISGMGCRLSFISTEPFRCKRIRISGSRYVALTEDERFAGMLPDEKLFDVLSSIAAEFGKSHPEDVMHNM